LIITNNTVNLLRKAGGNQSDTFPGLYGTDMEILYDYAGYWAVTICILTAGLAWYVGYTHGVAVGATGMFEALEEDDIIQTKNVFSKETGLYETEVLKYYERGDTEGFDRPGMDTKT
jgi:hypothetical protein